MELLLKGQSYRRNISCRENGLRATSARMSQKSLGSSGTYIALISSMEDSGTISTLSELR